MAYSNKHKIVLQAIVHEGLLIENKIQDLIIKLFGDNRVSVIINQINEQLQPLNMLIKKAQCEITGKLYWVLISTTLNEVTRYQTEFSKEQLALLRTMFSEIITSRNGCIQSTICLNLCSSLDIKMSKAGAEKFLEDIVNRKWLIYKNGYYYMGVRSITELMPYFRATYESNLNTCCLCKQVIFHGEKCTNCDTFFHLYCLKKFTMVHTHVNCPNCSTVVSDIDLSGIQDDLAVPEEGYE
ncbi:non-structural maintenance of chromosomes element 1 homolog [Bombus vosnesenskii]|uniref:Non-structural maintenance of chromosomes element 1 homolog n=1 Tax=Bombus vosnesenskii TaxID=207650 RepID=A0A6J3K5I0_9HYME|nr:non-structural maintenance of chromosomes element 1 homolog [Bombus vosnesenskii]XP_033348347.1 non-structural maintenance of chromosomes element 1 homolog [Bombus vosnesenskii]XP_033348348.1 non-structural maintenance of chromosomes element 1 homolog [Bombus vosnesenskii]XP_033348349.1 non-structural maintenance of chromosomes element 1 homolog [Bombus vosnesenskii]XP_033348350.1 non-structural maintenance of chromosomes element 1 homolog [Bombus vosnesenskii]XP_033348351.1 non-structural 